MLASAAGESDSAIAARLHTNRKTVTLWRTRFSREALESLWELDPGRDRSRLNWLICARVSAPAQQVTQDHQASFCTMKPNTSSDFRAD